jgi:hypothetical protein
MGKATVEFGVSIASGMVRGGSSFVDAQKIIQALMALPGKTTVETFERDPNPRLSLSIPYVLTIHNDQLPDGTRIVPKYKRTAHQANANGTVSIFDNFEGLDIMLPTQGQPPAGAAAGGQHASAPVGQAGNPVPPATKANCAHSLKAYHGLSDTFEYCAHCGAKKP